MRPDLFQSRWYEYFIPSFGSLPLVFSDPEGVDGCDIHTNWLGFVLFLPVVFHCYYVVCACPLRYRWFVCALGCKNKNRVCEAPPQTLTLTLALTPTLTPTSTLTPTLTLTLTRRRCRPRTG